MKYHHLLPPALALAASALWIVPQRQAISAAEVAWMKQIKEERIRAASAPREAAETTPQRQAIDWKTATVRFSLKDMTPEEREAFQIQLESLSGEELVAALAEISAMDLPDEGKRSLQRTLFNLLSEVDPAAAFEGYAHLFLHEGSPDSLAYALKNWARKDARAASGWLDRQIQSGEFDPVALDGTNERRMALEGALFNHLLKTDAAAAEARIAAYPPEHRWVLLRESGDKIAEPLQESYSKLVRALFPETHQAGLMGKLVYQYTVKPSVSPAEAYQQISGTMERTNATTAERERMASMAATSLFQDMADRGAVTRQDVEALRTWVSAQVPGKTGELTGQALGEAVARSKNLSYDEAAAMILEYHATQADDPMIHAFLRSQASQDDKEAARRLAEQIHDPDIRAKALMRLQLDIPRP